MRHRGRHFLYANVVFLITVFRANFWQTLKFTLLPSKVNAVNHTVKHSASLIKVYQKFIKIVLIEIVKSTFSPAHQFPVCVSYMLYNTYIKIISLSLIFEHQPIFPDI